MATPLKYKDVLERCKQWSGDLAELKELGDVIQGTFNAGQDKRTEKLCLALLKHDPPALYKARIYTLLSAFEGYHEDTYLNIAKQWIDTAMDQFGALGAIPDEVEEWSQRIQEHLNAPVEQPAPTTELEGLSLGGMDGAMDGVDDQKPSAHVHVHDTEKCKMCQYMRSDEFHQPNQAPTPEELEDLRKAKEKLEKAQAEREKMRAAAKAREVEERKIREKKAKIPGSLRMKLSAKAQQQGTGSRGLLDLFYKDQPGAKQEPGKEESVAASEEQENGEADKDVEMDDVDKERSMSMG
ncbi:hypothetical protein LTR17_012815 [Elasticomyces elasticus]|nr:hypothetical protein LTR17_012815 [Elasticomyces elasticus]